MPPPDPNLGHRSREVTWQSIVDKADPERRKAVREEPEYEFSRRTFKADRSKRGAYTPT